MPLHLLGKKSWNVYNPESIARVRKDEAAAKLHEIDAERRSRDHEATQRLQHLRTGSIPEDVTLSSSPVRSASIDKASSRKRRKLHGEDDTTRELRLAQENPVNRHASFDGAGCRIDLKSGASVKTRGSGPPQEQGMRFIDAAGTKQGTTQPWYSNRDCITSGGPKQEVSLDRWGNEDPRRLQREQQRLSANDPLVAMKKGIKRLKENEKERHEWRKQREQDLHEVEELARIHRRRRHRHSDEDSLENFDLDAVEDPGPKRHHKPRRHHHRSGSKDPRRNRHGRRSRSPLPSYAGHRERERTITAEAN